MPHVALARASRAEALERFEPGECEYDEPLLSVLMGERMADEPDRVFEPNTILGAG